MSHLRVKGVHINADHFAEHKNVKALKADDRKLFAHISKEEQEEAYAELWQQLHPEEKQKPAPPPKESEKSDAAEAETK